MADEVVKYHNNLVESVYSLQIVPKKLLLAAIQRVRDDLTVDEPAKDFCDMVGISYESEKSRLKADLRILQKTTIDIVSLKGDEWIQFQMVTRSEHKGGRIRLWFERGMREFIAELKERFTMYKIINIRPLASQYSVRIYELLAQYRNTDSQYREFEILDLKKKLGCEKKFKNYYDFHKNVLLKAEEELRANCDLYFTFAELKQSGSKKVTGIRFRLLHKKISQIEQSEDVLPGMPPPTPKERTENAKHMALELELRRKGMDHSDFEEFFVECGGFEAVNTYLEKKLKSEKDYISGKMGAGLIRKKIVENAKREWDLSRLEQVKAGERQRSEKEATAKRDAAYNKWLDAGAVGQPPK